MNGKIAFITAGACMSVAACSGGSGSAPPNAEFGSIRIAITDAPVDVVSVVNVQFSGVTLKPASGDEIRIDFDAPKDFDLLTLTGGVTAELLPDTVVPADRYNWVSLAVDAEFDNVFDSFAMTPMGQVELRVPGGSKTGLKLVSGFTVGQGQTVDLVIDWDLRKALSDPVGQPGFHLRPAMRVTNMAEVGTLRGTVDETLVMDADCSNDLSEQTGNAVYVYSGTVDAPGDIGDAVNEPLVTATVAQNGDGVYVYEINFLSVSEYSAAFTCQASDDDAETDDDIVFSPVQSFSIEKGATETVDFGMNM